MFRSETGGERAPPLREIHQTAGPVVERLEVRAECVQLLVCVLRVQPGRGLGQIDSCPLRVVMVLRPRTDDVRV